MPSFFYLSFLMSKTLKRYLGQLHLLFTQIPILSNDSGDSAHDFASSLVSMTEMMIDDLFNLPLSPPVKHVNRDPPPLSFSFNL